ncbi:hypothetical protein EVAR_38798_1 [Eumeta japonica]|uniref:Uncharacterized protein n=1 Tax=Eumeta variegata TaxID=151549 RepID=A0A4C1WMQ6_EUMVA|nr:hypothetical protein EVAR_38798_1 [Eumeta japonica]
MAGSCEGGTAELAKLLHSTPAHTTPTHSTPLCLLVLLILYTANGAGGDASDDLAILYCDIGHAGHRAPLPLRRTVCGALHRRSRDWVLFIAMI